MSGVIVIGDGIRVDLDRYVIDRRGDTDVKLRRQEWLLLERLAAAEGAVVKREILAVELWKLADHLTINLLHGLVYRVNVSGIGYGLARYVGDGRLADSIRESA